MKTLSPSERLYVAFHQFFFLTTGLVTTLGVQWLFYTGAATGESLFAQLSQSVGMILVGMLIPFLLRNKKQQYALIPTANENEDNAMQHINLRPMLPGNVVEEQETKEEAYIEGPIRQTAVIRLALLDVLANSCVTIGFSMIGSGMYQVIYSSVVVWCAILTYFFMGRTLTRMQWYAIIGTSAGLALSSVEQQHDDTKSNSFLMIGTLMTLGGTFLYACVYVFSDHILSKHSPPPLPARVCFYTGIYTTILTSTWIAFYTLPRFDQIIHVNPTVPRSMIACVYVLVTLANSSHSWSYYELIDRTGSVATGILQGLRAVLVYILSHVWFCNTDSAQCFSVYKGCGSFLVIGCVIIFTLASKQAKA